MLRCARSFLSFAALAQSTKVKPELHQYSEASKVIGIPDLRKAMAT